MMIKRCVRKVDILCAILPITDKQHHTVRRCRIRRTRMYIIRWAHPEITLFTDEASVLITSAWPEHASALMTIVREHNKDIKIAKMPIQHLGSITMPSLASRTGSHYDIFYGTRCMCCNCWHVGGK